LRYFRQFSKQKVAEYTTLFLEQIGGFSARKLGKFRQLLWRLLAEVSTEVGGSFHKSWRNGLL
jgi:hypothetical protein